MLKDRIKQIRKTIGLNQSDFGKQIGVKGNTIGNYEIGLRTPSDAVILSICREFNVSEQWLRNGEGDMFVSVSKKQEIAAFAGRIMSGTPDDFRLRFVAALAELSEEHWKLIEEMVEKLSESKKE